jgi:surface carbohydrate biosynthesis protein
MTLIDQKNEKNLLLIPVENQVRELDPKLLLACIATKYGFASVIGSRREMEFNIDRFPRAIYLSKSMTIRSLLFFRVAKKFGHEIITWDEEALVHLPPETYFGRRLDPRAIKFISHLFAWGEDNAALWRQYPYLPAGIPIHVTGNPRTDMLRPEFRAFYQGEIEEFQNRYGDFILVNTNFNHVNAYGPDMNLFKPPKSESQKPKFGRAARGMSRAYAEGLRDLKEAVFSDFQELIPVMSNWFPHYAIVVRPHPTENQDVYHRIAAENQNVYVTNENNVVPWLLAAKAVIHNGCTTGIEAYMLDVPAISYRKTVSETYDYGFYRLPNLISHQCFSPEELRDSLAKILDGKLVAAGGDERRALLDYHLAGREGMLACERIVSVLAGLKDEVAGTGRDSFFRTFDRWLITRGLHIAKRIKSSLPGSHNRPEFQRHRYPGISQNELKERISRFQRLLGDKRLLQVEQISNVLFLVRS